MKTKLVRLNNNLYIMTTIQEQETRLWQINEHQA